MSQPRPKGTAPGVNRLEPSIFEVSSAGRRGYELPPLDVPEADLAGLGEAARESVEGFPEASEVDVVRHFVRLSRLNYAVDLGLYPLGSCTMKYNPKINEEMARLDGFARIHPMQDESSVQGALRLMHELNGLLQEITGLHRFTLQPAAGAQGELTGIMIARAHLERRGDPRSVILIPDSAHGTNPASAHICGYRVEEIASDDRGCVDVEALRRRMGPDVAALMLTNPNTLGIFERDIEKICGIVHDRGGLVYMDGANMNALVGVARPGDMGVDILHLNLHKTFSTPHGGGGPGSGPVGVVEALEPYLPMPTIERKDGAYLLDWNRPQSVGKVSSFMGNFGMHVRAYAYIMSFGPAGIRQIAERAVLNANYIRARLKDTYHLPFQQQTLHEVIFDDTNQKPAGVTTLDIAKRLMDYGFHPPTIYFPLIVHGAIMIEPTETESRAELEVFIEAMKAIDREARENPDLVRAAPHHTPVGRLDEAAAARNPRLRWKP
ncbi:MAG TPA: aminomethyl-transferring glycine dehydrogenase subunit GcvPB [Patescibacteria group bacterium]|jgi:glycine dehydrogenase subunit 2|nr:aminomethyl-transferring glycine dehydrogenase subunit GcvPB [Patescibacteria group bacterium]